MKKLTFFVVVLFSVAMFSGVTYARSGCCSWHDGVRADGCGCNDGTPLSATCAPYYTCQSSYVEPSYVVPTCSNGYYDDVSDQCVCNSGYAPSLSGSSCLRIPENASQAYNGADVWLCNEGYEESGNSCVPIIVEEVEAMADVTAETAADLDSDSDLESVVLDVEETEPEPEPVEEVENNVVPKNDSTEKSDDESSALPVLIVIGVVGGYVLLKKKRK